MLLPRKMLSQVGVEGEKEQDGSVGQDRVLIHPTVGRSHDTGTPVKGFETPTSCEEEVIFSQGTWVLGTSFDFEQVFDISWLPLLQIDRNACRGLCCVLHLQRYGPKLAEKLNSTVGAKYACILGSPKPTGTEL